LYLSLSDIASYGISMQLITIIGGLASIYISTYQPRIAHLRILQNKDEIKNIYIKGQIFLFSTYLIGGAVLLFCGSWALVLIKSQTKIMTTMLLLVALIISFLENNHATAGAILLSNNEVPFFKASLFVN
jgi:O-antigen/teichoic acid export membrane protein